MTIRGAYRGVPSQVVDDDRKARRLARATSTTTQTGITTVVDLTGVSITFTVTQRDIAGGLYACYVEAEPGWLYGATAALIGLTAITDESGNSKDSKTIASAVTGSYSAPPFHREVITAAGTYTRKLRIAKQGGGTGTWSHNVDLAESTAWIEARLVRVAA